MKKSMTEMKQYRIRCAVQGIALLILFLICILTIVSCTQTNADAADMPVTTGVDVIDSAIKAYNRIADDQPLTADMLAEITSLRISATNYTYEKEGYMLVDVSVNGEKHFCGVLEQYMDKERYKQMLAQVEDDGEYCYEEKNENGELSVYHTSGRMLKNRLRAFYIMIDTEDETLSEEQRRFFAEHYPEAEQGGMYVLSTDILQKESNEIVWGLAQFGLLDGKFIEGDSIDLEKLGSLPNLKTLTLCGVGTENTLDGLMIYKEDFITMHNENTDN